MVYLLLDTNTWIYLANGFDPYTEKHENEKHFEWLSILRKMTDEGTITVLTNAIVRLEWERNKTRTEVKIKKLKNKLAGIDAQFQELFKDVPYDEALKTTLAQRLQQEIADNERHIGEVNAFLADKCREVPISQEVKLLVFELSIQKKVPFHNNKNNSGDAAILLSGVEFLRGEEYVYSSLFVSNNTEEYADPKNKDLLHPELLELIGDVDLQYKRGLSAALNISEGLVEEERAYYRAFTELADYAVEMFTWKLEDLQEDVMMSLEVPYHHNLSKNTEVLTIGVIKTKGAERADTFAFMFSPHFDKSRGLSLYFLNLIDQEDNLNPAFTDRYCYLPVDDKQENTYTGYAYDCYGVAADGSPFDIVQASLTHDTMLVQYFNHDGSEQGVSVSLFGFKQQYILLP